ncbi:1-acylglycerol-3-phosphate O-acyltransferase [Sorangium cellulosum]|uniref:1-acyl-sn-glycerol-3-phosphate acyltransferase n=1 Tax=Sorangium cellulosum TaxID=56 RepID=A0A4P2Q2S0_SORCE|nr:lysophospholipid acyltransferase family protein [Sorangium cellulosum]AUX23574.1 1-acylglycerol-3-phosphate O-acyltransferase [Sorangium cellulosum]
MVQPSEDGAALGAGVRRGPVEGARTALACAWAALFLLVLLPIGLVCFPFDRRQWMHDRLSVVWARGALWLVGVRVEAEGVERVRPGERYVIVANHQSALDILALLVVLQARAPIRFLAKRALFRVPLLGWGMRLYGHTPVDRSRGRGAAADLDEARRNVMQRWSTVFFPEGTRSATGRLLPFRLGAFRTASAAGARLLPVTLDGSGALLPKGRRAAAPGVVRVVVHAPLAPPAASLAELHAAAEACRAVVAAALPEALRRAG